MDRGPPGRRYEAALPSRQDEDTGAQWETKAGIQRY